MARGSARCAGSTTSAPATSSRSPREDGQLLTLPFDRRTVPEIDLAGGRLVVEPPAELAAEAPR